MKRLPHLNFGIGAGSNGLEKVSEENEASGLELIAIRVA